MEKAHAAVETLLQTCARGHGVAAQNLLTEAAAERFVAATSAVDGCREVLALQEFASSRVARIHANAGFATVVVETPSGERSQVELEQVRGVWEIANPLYQDLPPPE